jgi:hypothetical protein
VFTLKSTDVDSASDAGDLKRTVEGLIQKLGQTPFGAEIDDALVQQLVYLSVKLYSQSVDAKDGAFRPIPADQELTATEVAVIVNELMLSADLNMFDLAMWSNRARG